MNHPLYDHPREYDIAFGWDPGLEVDTYVDLLSRFGSCPVRRVLEVACGTGRLLLPMAQRGLDCVGIDAHAGMIDFARTRGKALHLKADFQVADMRSFKLKRKCDGAFCALSGFRYLVSPDDIFEHFLALTGALIPGAAYVVDLDLAGPDYDPAHPGQTWTASRDGVVVETTWRALGGPDWGRRTVREEGRMQVNDGKAKTTADWVCQEELRVWTADDFRGHAWAGGFEIASWWLLPFRVADPFRPVPWVPVEQTRRVLAVLRMR